MVRIHEDPSGAPCMTQDVEVVCPWRVNEIAENYETPFDFHFCNADFQVQVTPFESAPLPGRTKKVAAQSTLGHMAIRQSENV